MNIIFLEVLTPPPAIYQIIFWPKQQCRVKKLLTLVSTQTELVQKLCEWLSAALDQWNIRGGIQLFRISKYQIDLRQEEEISHLEVQNIKLTRARNMSIPVWLPTCQLSYPTLYPKRRTKTVLSFPWNCFAVPYSTSIITVKYIFLIR